MVSEERGELRNVQNIQGNAASAGSAEDMSLRDAISGVVGRALTQVLRPPSAQGSDSVRLVHEHQLEIFAETFPIWVTVFAILNLLTAPATLGLFVWIVVSFASEDKPCDVPLRTWVVVEFVSTGCGLVHCTVLQCCCAEHDEGHITPILPWHARVYAFVISVGDCFWTSVGLHWIRIADTCADTSPELYKSVLAYTSFSMACFVFVAINAIGLYSILSWMLRNGMLNSKDAAPPGTLQKLKIITFDAESQIFKDTSECCICMAAFTAGSGADNEIRSTACGHIFHSRCLGNWLRLRRSCPLCRRDVCENGQAEEASVAPPAAAAANTSAGAAAVPAATATATSVATVVVAPAAPSVAIVGRVEDFEERTVGETRKAEDTTIDV